MTLPFTIFILISYFEQIPRDLYRAARADGASHWQALAHVYLPLSLPALVASLMFAFLTSWNEFIFALILTQNIASQTLPIVISGFVMDFTTSFSFVNAAGVIAIVPPVVLAVAVRALHRLRPHRRRREGLRHGARMTACSHAPKPRHPEVRPDEVGRASKDAMLSSILRGSARSAPSTSG